MAAILSVKEQDTDTKKEKTVHIFGIYIWLVRTCGSSFTLTALDDSNSNYINVRTYEGLPQSAGNSRVGHQ